MRFRLWLETHEDQTVKAGTVLFHGTVEQFDAAKLNTGGYDDVLWLAYTPDIGQAYIPYARPKKFHTERLGKPAWSKEDREMQQALGIHYDYDNVKWDTMMPTSWSAPKKNDGGYWDRSTFPPEVIDDMMTQAGHEPDERYVSRNKKYGREFVVGKDNKEGRLFIITVKEDLRVFDYAQGRESDLQDIDYHNIPLFRKLEEQGYDGVIITDFAQTKDYGNMPHNSIGIFKDSIKKLEWETIAAKHTNFDKIDRKSRHTPEYEDYLKRKREAR